MARELAADPPAPPAPAGAAANPVALEPLQRLVLADEVERTLFAEYAAHRAGERGSEETGWLLLGRRRADEVVVLATLPAPSDRDAGEAHVWVSGPVHLLAQRVVRQQDRSLSLVGLVHTHPGSLRHPSRWDYKGDKEWVRQLRGGDGVFGIGTADAEREPSDDGKPSVRTEGGLRFSWYTLGTGDTNYRDAPLEVAPGPDLALGLRPVWPLLEAHAARLDRMAQQLARVRFDVVDGKYGPALAAVVALAEPGAAVSVVLDGPEARYVYEAGEDAFQVDPGAAHPDAGVYRILAELAARG